MVASAVKRTLYRVVVRQTTTLVSDHEYEVDAPSAAEASALAIAHLEGTDREPVQRHVRVTHVNDSETHEVLCIDAKQRRS